MAGLNSEKKASKKKADGGNTTKSSWDDWGGYMQAKVQKLDVQFQEELQKGPQDTNVPNIFDKVVIHINGYTVPPADELRHLVYLHGGRYQQYYTKRTVTHIIATNLPDSKIKELRDELVVHPSWILDSIKTGRLLPVDQFLLYQGKKAAQKLLGFTSKPSHGGLPSVASSTTASKTSHGELPSVASEPSPWASVATCSTYEPPPEEVTLATVASSSTMSKLIPGGVPTVAGSTMTTTHEDNRTALDFSSKMLESVTDEKESLPQDATLFSEAHSIEDEDDDELHDVDKLEPRGPGFDIFHEASTLEAGTNLPKVPETTPVRKSNTTAVPTCRAGDPNFVAEFYNNSRLHYLSTWGAEFKKYTSDIIKCRTASGLICRGTGVVGPHGRVIMHVDMDSFFVSVTLRDQPQLRGKPIAVCHAGKGNTSLEQGAANGQLTSPTKSAAFFNSMSEIASCSYEARAVGVRNGMFLGSARKLCPDIHCVPYQFDNYRQVSQKLYDILVTYSHDIEAVSCDEAFIDVSERLEENETPAHLAEKIRAEIKTATGCTASVGIASNILLSRMCTRKAKPDGCFYLATKDDVNQFMGPQKVEDLPGVGWSLGHKLQSLGVETCFDLQKLNLQTLQREFGPKTGLVLYQSSRGIDDRTLKTERERKSVSAEINYGIRFTKESEVEKFISELAEEVHKRLLALEVKGRCITLKMKVRKAGAPVNPMKFMGHGRCDNIARSYTLPNVTDEAQIIAKQCHTLLQQLSVTPEDLRGMGIQISKLADKDASSLSKNSRSLLDFVKPRASHEEDVENVREKPGQHGFESPLRRHGNFPPLPRFSPQVSHSIGNSAAEGRLEPGEDLCLPSPSQIDPSVFDALPEDIRRSIEKSYAARNQRLSLNRIREEGAALQPPAQKPVDTRHKRKTLPKTIPLRFEENPVLPEVAVRQSSSELLPSPSQVDPEFLAALPDDVRQELEQAYKQKNLHGTHVHVQGRPSRVHVPDVVTEGSTAASNAKSVLAGDVQTKGAAQIVAQPKEVSLGGAVSLTEVKKVVKEWTEAYDAPLEEDMDVLVEYLLDLIDSQNLEQLWAILKFLDRRIQGREDWHPSCVEALAKLQPVLKRKYGSKLAEEPLKFFKL